MSGENASENNPKLDEKRPPGLSDDIKFVKSLIPIALGMLILMAVLAVLMKFVL
jgi:hypothetical protein